MCDENRPYLKLRKIQMRNLFLCKLAMSFLWLFAAVCYLCSLDAYAAAEQQSNSQSGINPDENESIVVARIAYYTITKDELEKRLMTELYPYDYDYSGEQAEPVDAKKMLTEMVAEKAMIIEARAQGLLENEAIKDSVKRFMERRLVELLLEKHLEGKISVTEGEIAQRMQADSKLDKARAKVMVEREKANMLWDQYYKQIYVKSGVKKLNQNFPRVVQIHERLLHHPKQPRKASWIQNSQVREELTPEERNLVLAQYNTGRITLKDWFDALCDIVPPRRPRNLNTPQGVDQLLERAMRMPLLVSEAKALRLDNDQDLLKQVRDYEDRRLLGEVQSAKRKELKEPTTEQIITYFSKNKESFGTSKGLKIDLIWCEDLEMAKEARAALDGGKDFEEVRKQYSLEKEGKPFTTHPSSEGIFWKDLWAGDPNSIVGPVKGFYRQGIKWRIVKIMEKTPGKEQPYSSNMEQQVKNRMMSEQFKALITQYGKELLDKYPYQIYDDRIKDIDPLDIP
jgi:hypothetical protein